MPPQREKMTPGTSPLQDDPRHAHWRMEPEMEVVLLETPPPPTLRVQTSVLRRESFLIQFVKTKGPPQITLILMLVALGLGSCIGVIPAVMTDRFARLHFGYTGEEECSDILHSKPAACLDASAQAQSAVASSNFVSNLLTFLTSSLIGSLSDEYGRKGK